MSDRESRLNPTLVMAAALLGIVCAVLFFYKLGEGDVGTEAEARVLITAAEMSRNKTWLIPTVGGEDRWEKPPLYVWAVRLASVFNDGEVTPEIARAPGALSILLLVMLAGWWTFQHLTRYPRGDGLEFTPEAYALLAGLMIASSPEIFDLARAGTADSLFAFLCFAALYCLGESFETRRSYVAEHSWRSWVMGGYFLIGAAMLAKGPISFLFVLIPYMATCWAYKMRRPDWIHLPGALLALAVGGSWYLAAIWVDKDAGKVFYQELIARRFGQGVIDGGPIYFYFSVALKSFFPWILLAAVVIYRNLWQIERTPTLLTWSCSLLAGLIWLSVVGTKSEDFFAPVAPMILLLATDALARWDFGSKAGTAYWMLLRVLRWAAVFIAIPISIYLSTDAGLVIAIALIIFGILFAVHRARAKYTYAVWQRTVHAASLLVIVFLGAEAAYVRDLLPRQGFQSSNKAFIEQVKAHLPETAEVYYSGAAGAALNSYLMGRLLPRAEELERVADAAGPDTYLLTDENVRKLWKDPNLAPIVAKVGARSNRVRAALFKVNPSASPPPEGDPLVSRFAHVPPCRIAVLGDAGHGTRDSRREIARRLRALDKERPFHGVLMIGDPAAGETLFERLDFTKRFDRTYEAMLADGTPFYGLLGSNDLASPVSISAVTSYPLLQMGGQRFYMKEFYGGLIQYFALEGQAMEADPADPQWAWIERELEKSSARWKIVGVHPPLISFAKDEEVEEKLSERLLPMLDKHRVHLVVSAAEPWYQRIIDPAHAPVFIVGGWSGRAKKGEFAADPRLAARSDDAEGIVYLEIGPDKLAIRAVNKYGGLVDHYAISADGSPISELPEEVAPPPPAEPSMAEAEAQAAAEAEPQSGLDADPITTGTQDH